MRKSCKKIVSVLIAMIILFTVAPITTSALTQNDVVSWMDSKNGTTIYDGGSQCVAAFNSYLRIWGISNPISKYPVNYAYQIFNYNAPDDWQKISGSGNYQVGDVVIWNSSVDIGDTSEITASGQGTISYISSNTNVATVNNSGIVTGISAGTATITVTATGNNNYNEASKTFTVLVKNSHVLGDVNCDGVI